MNIPFDCVEENARVKPNEPALVHGDVVLSFAQVHQIASSIGTAMRIEGVRPGNVLLLAGGNPIIDYMLSLGALHEGATVAIQSGATYLAQTGADFAFSRNPISGFTGKTVVVNDQWLQQAQTLTALKPGSFESSDTPIRLVQTSGTTGIPKLVEYDFDSIASFSTVGVPKELLPSYRPEKRLTALPLSALAGATHAYFAIKSGTTFHLSFNHPIGDGLMIQKRGLNSLFSSPMSIANIFEQKDSAQNLASLDLIFSTGAAMSQLQWQKLKLKTKATIINRFGATETGSIAWRVMKPDDKDGYVGQLLDDVEVIVADETGTLIDFGQIGRLGFKTPGSRNRYRNDQLASTKQFINGYFFTGDEGYLLGEELFFVGRADERINAGGVKRDPATLDAEICELAGIVDAAVFGFDDSNGLRMLAVAVVLNSGYSANKVGQSIAQVVRFKGNLAIVPVASIPRSGIGKVQRIELENRYSDQARKLTSQG